MIIVSGIIELDPANHDAAAEAMQKLSAATVQEEGNIEYAFWADLGQSGRFRVFEQWETEAAIEAHMTAPHMQEFFGTVGGLGITSSAVDKHTVSETSKLM